MGSLVNDRRAHYLTMLGDACMAAGLAGIPVELELRDGTRMLGTPSAQPADGNGQPVSGTGYESRLLVGESSAQFEDVVGFAIRSP